MVSVPEMIRKMTSLPAFVYGLDGRGVVKVGMKADLCVFDAETIRDRADYLNVSRTCEGLSYVIVDGKVVLEDGKYNGVRVGELFRKP